MTLFPISALVHSQTDGPTTVRTDTCPRCAHARGHRTIFDRDGCDERLQVIYDQDEVRCGCSDAFHDG